MRILLLVVLARTAFGCDCVAPSVRGAKKHAEVVFRGTIIGFRGSTVDDAGLIGPAKIAVFRVTRVWKGQVGPDFEMAAFAEGAACIGFWPSFLRVGNDLLVYAYQINGPPYITDICSRTQLASATKDFTQLGPGHEPKKPKHAP
jgi:hypothetical protein